MAAVAATLFPDIFRRSVIKTFYSGPQYFLVSQSVWPGGAVTASPANPITRENSCVAAPKKLATRLATPCRRR